VERRLAFHQFHLVFVGGGGHAEGRNHGEEDSFAFVGHPALKKTDLAAQFFNVFLSDGESGACKFYLANMDRPVGPIKEQTNLGASIPAFLQPRRGGTFNGFQLQRLSPAETITIKVKKASNVAYLYRHWRHLHRLHRRKPGG
jgi:hypothetical protein